MASVIFVRHRAERLGATRDTLNEMGNVAHHVSLRHLVISTCPTGSTKSQAPPNTATALSGQTSELW
jgi:hypothetical protein